MGLDICSISINRHYSEKANREYGEEYDGCDTCGFWHYINLMDRMVSYFSNGKIADKNKLNDYLGGFFYWHNGERDGKRKKYVHLICLDNSDFPVNQRKQKKVVHYLSRIKELKKEYPKVYDILPIVFLGGSNDGDIPYFRLKGCLDRLVEFRKESGQRVVGYEMLVDDEDYNWLDGFIKVVKSAIDHKGMIEYD